MGKKAAKKWADEKWRVAARAVLPEAEAKLADVAAPQPMQGIALAQEAAPHRPSKTERRNQLIAAYVAFQAVRFDVDEGWMIEKSLAAALGRLELRD